MLKDSINLTYSDDSLLKLVTDNSDSVNPYFEHPVSPFCPTMSDFSVFARIHDTSYLKVTFKDVGGTEMGTFMWTKLNPGVYRFDWWEYYGFEKSGMYFSEVNTRDYSKTNKIVYIK